LHPYNETLWNDQVLKEPVDYRTIQAVRHAEETVASGFTTLRDLGTEGAGYADLSVKRAIDEGLIPGPRLAVATRAIVATGCYGPGPRGFRPDLELPKGAQEVSGAPEILAAVREQAGHGADWIKVYADYRCGPDGAEVPTFTQDELKVLVEAAHTLGRKVSAHSTTAEGMRRATLAGVDTIEHGYGGTEEVFRLMAAHGVAYLPTLEAENAYAQYFDGYVPGKTPPTEGMKRSVQAFQTAGRGDGRLRQRRGGLRPRHELARARRHGPRRHEAGRGPLGRHRGRRPHPWLAGPPGPDPPRFPRRPGGGGGRPDERHRRGQGGPGRDAGGEGGADPGSGA